MHLVSGDATYMPCSTPFAKHPPELPGRHSSWPSTNASSQRSFKTASHSFSEMGGYTASLESKVPFEISSTPKGVGCPIFSCPEFFCEVSGDCMKFTTSPFQIISRNSEIETCSSTAASGRHTTGGHVYNSFFASPPPFPLASEQSTGRNDACHATPSMLPLRTPPLTAHHSMMSSEGEGGGKTTHMASFSYYQYSGGGCSSGKHLDAERHTTKGRSLPEGQCTSTPLDTPVKLVTIRDYQCGSEQQANHCDMTQATMISGPYGGEGCARAWNEASNSSTLRVGVMEHSDRHDLNKQGPPDVSSSRLRWISFMEPLSERMKEGERTQLRISLGADMYNASRHDAHNVALSFLFQRYGKNLVQQE